MLRFTLMICIRRYYQAGERIKDPAVGGVFYSAGFSSTAGSEVSGAASDERGSPPSEAAACGTTVGTAACSFTFGFQLTIFGAVMILLLTNKLLSVGDGCTPLESQYSMRSFLTKRFFLCGS